MPTVALLLLKWAFSSTKRGTVQLPTPYGHLYSMFSFTDPSLLSVLRYVFSMCHFAFCTSRLVRDGQITDAKLEFDIAPPPAGSIALVCLAVALVVTLVAGLFHYLANGWKLLVGDFVGNRTSQGHGLVDYVLA
ncbi:hypothetical protein BU15DRAFT_69190 [Melanogaster broomeanus]|nr:hypothetical protein BU15DRAFT_69190 [Melanogaster broomeanus]